MVIKNKKYSLIIPVYNEAKVIEKTVKQYYDFSLKLKNSELIIAEDGSTDGTKKVLRKLKKTIPFKLVIGKERKGYNKAVIDALKLANHNYVLFSDGGGGHDPNDFLRMLKNINKYDIVSGYKKPRRDPLSRIIYSKVYNTYISLLFLHRFKDIDCGFKVYRKNVLDDILPQCKTLKECISTEIMLRSFSSGYKIKEIPVKHFKRDLEEVKTFTLKRLPKIVLSLLKTVFKLRIELLKK